jgi:hypothetical protein
LPSLDPGAIDDAHHRTPLPFSIDDRLPYPAQQLNGMPPPAAVVTERGNKTRRGMDREVSE